MSTQFVRRAIPIGGVNNGTPADGLQEGESPNLLNVRFRFNEIRPGPGRATLAPAVPHPIQVIARFSMDDQTKWIVMITDQRFYKWGINAPGDVQQWTQVGGVTLTGFGRWDWTTGEDCFFFTRKNGGGIYRWKGGASLIDMVPNVPFTDARFVEYFNNRLVVSNVAEAGKSWANRIRYPVNANHEDWSGNGSGYIDLYEPEQEPIQGMKVLNNRLVILREHSLSDLAAGGSLAQIFLVEQRTSNVGTLFPATVDCNGIMLFFVGNDGNVWGWNGSQLQSIGDPLYKTFENLVDLVGGRDIYFGKIYPFMNEYWLWLGGQYVYVFDFLQGRWMIDYFPNIAAIGDAEFYVTPNNWGVATGTWGSWGMTTWQSMLTSRSTSRLVVGLTDGTTITVGKDIQGYYTNELIDCFVETKDYYTNQSNNPVGVQNPIGPMMLRTCERLLLIYMYNNDADKFELGVSTDRGRTWTTFLITPNTVGFGLADWKVTGPIMRFRLRQTSTKPVFRWQGLIEEFLPGGPYQALEQPPGVSP